MDPTPVRAGNPIQISASLLRLFRECPLGLQFLTFPASVPQYAIQILQL